MQEVIKDIYQVFKDYFKEENVDIQKESDGYIIIVHWDTITITNEYDEQVTIQDFYAKIRITQNGRLLCSPFFIKTTYSNLHWKAGYVHSHIPRLYDTCTGLEWNNGCLGEGPIKNTIYKLSDSLRSHYKDPIMWTLFCFELDKYVRTESVQGVPYFRMRDIVSRSISPRIHAIIFPRSVPLSPIDIGIGYFNAFMEYVLDSKKLPFSYRGGGYSIGMSDNDIILLISNLFIKWYNNNKEYRDTHPFNSLLRQDILMEAFIKDGKMVKSGTLRLSRPLPEDPIFTFKGKDVYLKIARTTDSISSLTILNPTIISNIIYRILRTLNCCYGKQYSNFNKKTRIF